MGRERSAPEAAHRTPTTLEAGDSPTRARTGTPEACEAWRARRFSIALNGKATWSCRKAANERRSRPHRARTARDLAGRRNGIWVRRAGVGLLALVLLLALLNAFGQRPSTVAATAAGARLSVHAPDRVRSGLLGEATITVAARRRIRDAVLVLDSGWFDGLSVNSIEPAPAREGSLDGRTSLAFGPIAAGSSYVVYVQFQVNPTNVGRYPRSVQLFDGARRLTSVEGTLTVFP
jgi:hypothetical protein